MWKRGRIGYLCLALAVGACGTGPRDDSLSGVVTDSLSGAPVHGAQIRTPSYIAYADPNGAYDTPIALHGRQMVYAVSALHETDSAEVDVDGPTVRDFRLRRLAPFVSAWTGDSVTVVDLQGATTLSPLESLIAWCDASGLNCILQDIEADDIVPAGDGVTARIGVSASAGDRIAVTLEDRNGHRAVFQCERDTSCSESPP